MPHHAAPDGFHSVTPALTVKNTPAALEFYRRVFDAEEILRLTAPDGTIVHAELRIGDSIVMFGEENAEWGNLSPETLGGSPVALNLYVRDADATVRQAVEAGATVLIPVEDQFYGDRSGRVRDPFGHLWIVSTRRETMSPTEMQRRFDEFLTQMAERSDG